MLTADEVLLIFGMFVVQCKLGRCGSQPLTCTLKAEVGGSPQVQSQPGILSEFPGQPRYIKRKTLAKK